MFSTRNWLVCFLTISSIIVSASTDTLRMFNKSDRLLNAQGSFDLQVARFDVTQPIRIKSIILTVDGEQDSFTVRLFGHEGGTAFPQLMEDVVPKFSIHKNSSGLQKISVPIDSSVVFRNNQFFVGVEGLSSGTFLKQSVVPVPVHCTSTSGGSYGYQYFMNNGSWSATSRSFAIEVVVEKYDLPKQRYFEDITTSAQIVGSGDRSAAADFDKDGLVDILQGGKLLKNSWWNGNKFEDVTAASGISGNPRANLFIDMNNNGHLDVLFLEANDSSFIFLNDGKGKFDKHFLSGIEVNSLDRINAVSVADINNDNYPDLFVGQLWATYPDALPKFLFINDGQNNFVDQSDLLYKNLPLLKSAPCRGSQFVDVNNDGCIDLFVTNYVTTASKSTSPRDELWLNNGDGSFTNVIAQTGIDTTIGPSFWNMSGGCAWSDYDNDGDMDLLAPTLSHPRFMNGNGGEYTQPTTIYRNNSNGTKTIGFTNIRATHGIQYEETHAGAAWGDFTNDGLQDFFISTFYGCRYNDLYVQRQNGSFELVSLEAGIHEKNGNQDGLWLDVNNDGKLDLLAGGRLYQNKGPFYGDWIEIIPESKTQNVIGAKLSVYTNKGELHRMVTVGSGQKMQRPLRQHFGLGYVQHIDSVVIQWPGCNAPQTTYTQIEKNGVYRLTQEGQTTLYTQMPAEKQNIMIHPNPFINHIYIESNMKIVGLTLHDINGRKLMSRNNDGETNNVDFTVDSSLPSGIYVVHVVTKNGVSHHRILKN